MVIELFQAIDYVPDGEVSLLPMLRSVFADVLGPDTTNLTFELYFCRQEDLTPDRGMPSLVNLGGSHGFVRVQIQRNGELLYRHPLPVRELVAEPLRSLLRRRDPNVQHWGYRLSGPGLESITPADMKPDSGAKD